MLFLLPFQLYKVIILFLLTYYSLIMLVAVFERLRKWLSEISLADKGQARLASIGTHDKYIHGVDFPQPIMPALCFLL